MSVSCKFERSLLSHEENETVRVTHHPAIYEQDAEALQALRVRLRGLRDKERTLTRQKQRDVRGKAEPRGLPGTAERPLHRKQIFAAALKRVNRELGRVHALTARTAHVEAAWRALALRRAAKFEPHPPAGDPPRMRACEPFRAGAAGQRYPRTRASQATKRAQAARDSRS
jgi:hypothetical protein